jgi:hypothetical protein
MIDFKEFFHTAACAALPKIDPWVIGGINRIAIVVKGCKE